MCVKVYFLEKLKLSSYILYFVSSGCLPLLEWVLLLRMAKQVPLTDQYPPVEANVPGLKRKAIAQIRKKKIHKRNQSKRTKLKAKYKGFAVIIEISMCSFFWPWKIYRYTLKRSQNNIGTVYNMKHIEKKNPQNSWGKNPTKERQGMISMQEETSNVALLTLEKRHLRRNIVNDIMYRLLGWQWSLQSYVK